MEQDSRKAMEGGGGSSAGEEESWSASTNWDVVEGSAIRDPISVETSADDDVAPSSSPGNSLVLHRPLSDDSLPCEVTVYFKEKHELHQIYVRSTARVYEIYYTLNQLDNSKEYLCTVRCSAAAEEVGPLSSTEEAVLESQNSGFETIDMQGNGPRVDSSSNEDGWIEVQVPHSSLQTSKVNTLSKNADYFYEATAQISDASPCASITLRFLSLQTRTHVQIDEIYIYSDPVDNSISDGLTGTEDKFGGNSLLAMFAPTLMQLSKSRRSDVLPSIYPNSSGMQKYHYEAESGSERKERHVAHEVRSSMEDHHLQLQQRKVEAKPEHLTTDTDQEAAPSMPYQSMELLQKQGDVKPKTVQLESSQIVSDKECYCNIGDSKLKRAQKTKVDTEHLLSTSRLSGPDQASVHDHEDISQSNSGIEKKLDELVSRIGRLEAFFSRFEENMIKPLSSIDSRLQRLEQQFDAFAVGHQSCGKGSLSKISAPEFSCDDTDSDADENYHTSCEVKEDISFIIPSSPVRDISPETMSSTCPDLVVKSPEIPENCEDNVTIGKESAYDPDARGQYKNHSSIDCALASALAAFLTLKPLEDEKDHSEPSDAKDMSSSVRTIPDGTDGSISDLESGLEPETAHQESPLSVVADSDTPSSDNENGKFGISDRFANSTAFDDSSDDNLDLPLSHSKSPSGLIIMAPEFPNDDDVSLNSDDSDPTFKSHYESQEFVSNDSQLFSSFTALDPSAEFRTSSSTLTSSISSVKANHHDCNDMPFAMGAASKGANRSHALNHGDTMSNEINCGYILGSTPFEGGLKYEPKKHDCVLEVPVGGSTTVPSESDLREFVYENTHCLASVGASPGGVKSHFFSYLPSHDDSIVNVKFASDPTLRSNLPLDILLAETYKSTVHSSDTNLDNHLGGPYSDAESALDRDLMIEIPLGTLLGEIDVPEGQDSDVNHVNGDIGGLYSLTSQWMDPSSSTISQLVHDVGSLSLGSESLYSDDAVHHPQNREFPFISLI